MKNRYAFVLLIAVAAAPAAAQPIEQPPVPAPARPAQAPAATSPVPPPAQPVPARDPDAIPRVAPTPPIPIGPGPSAFGAVGLGPLGPAPALAPFGADPGDGALAALAGVVPMPVMPAFEAVMPAMPPMPDEAFLAGRMAFTLGQDRGRDREAELREREREREAELYGQGYNAALDSRYDRAVAFFDRVIELKGARVDAALYWKAYSQNRLGQRAEALTTLATLAKTSPNSTYRKQANVLEAEVRRDIGQPVRPQDSTDEEVKLMALQALQHTAPEEAIPMLEKLLEGTSGPKVKQRALFVLAQSKSPRARDVLRNYAKGGSTPELQSQAIQYLGVHGGPEHRALLAEIYGTAQDVDMKRRILRAFMMAGEKDRLFKAAQGEQNQELRMEAVTQLGHMNAHEELWQLYQKETALDVKRRIVRSMHAGGSIDRLVELAQKEQNPDLRRDAVRALGTMRSTRTGDVLVQIYNSDANPDVRKSVINALFIQENATALVALARKEQDVNMKKELVGRLSNMRNKVATDYMIELLNR
jgi:HEAT repeat protein